MNFKIKKAIILLHNINENYAEINAILKEHFSIVDKDKYWCYNKDLENKVNILKDRFNTITEKDFSFSELYYYDKSPDFEIQELFGREYLPYTQCLIDAALFIISNEDYSEEFRVRLLEYLGILCYIFDRGYFSYYIHQDKISKLISYLNKIYWNFSNTTKVLKNDPDIYYAPLYNAIIEIENGVENEDEYCISNLQFATNKRKFYKNEINKNIFKDYYEHSINQIEVSHSDFENNLYDYYSNTFKIIDNTEKNIGGFVCLYDTSLEFQKLETNSDKIKMRPISELNFEKVVDDNSLINLALNDEVSIISIKIIS